MFLWTIDLLSNMEDKDGDQLCHRVVELKQDPNFQEGDVLWVNCNLDRPYFLKAKVVGKEKSIYFPDENLKYYGEEAIKNGLLIESTIIESEDEGAIFEIDIAIFGIDV